MLPAFEMDALYPYRSGAKEFGVPKRRIYADACPWRSRAMRADIDGAAREIVAPRRCLDSIDRSYQRQRRLMRFSARI